MSRSRTTINIGIAVIIILLLINAFLLWNKVQQDKKIETQSTEKQELAMAKTELEKTYYEAMSELEAMRTGNDSLNVLINQQQDELTNQRQRILRMADTQKELRASMDEMKNQNESFIARINELMTENEELALALDKSEMQRTEVSQKYEEQLERGDELTGQVEGLEATKEQLRKKEEQRAAKVKAASVVKTNRVSINGLKIRGSGKQVEKAKADKIELVEVCFNTTKNFATPKGKELFHVRIMNPEGQTLAVESTGSGTINDVVSGKKMRYTTSTTIDYQQENQQVCVDWKPNSALRAGRYEALIYNKGYLTGKGSTIFK